MRLVEKSARVLDPNGKPVAKAVVEIIAADGQARADSPSPGIRHQVVETDSAGRFVARVPAAHEFGLMVRSNQGAITRMVVPEGADTLADIQLARGVALSGRVLSRDGKPLAGCVVSLRSNDDQPLRTELSLGSHAIEIRAYEITDPDGRFRFSPVLGDFLIRLVPKGDAFRPASAEFRRAIDPPPFVPVALHLDKPGEKSITLIEAPTAIASGTIRSKEGNPVAGLTVRLLISPPPGNSFINLSETKSDQDGRYSVRAPIPLEDLVLMTEVKFAAGGEQLEVQPADPKLWSSRSQRGMLRIHPFDGDRTGLDLVMDTRQQGPGNEVLRKDESSAISPDLLNLERAIKLARDAYVKASAAAQTQEQKDRAHDLFPSESLIERCLVVEAKHRGTRTAIGAMHWIMRMAAMNSQNPATAARERLITILHDHYIANSDVDLLIDEFPHGDTPRQAESLLRRIAAESPHDYVRATALFELAEVLLSQVYLNEIYKHASYDKKFDAMLSMQQSERTRKWMLAEKAKVERLRDAYRNRDMKAMTTEAERLYEQIATQFPDVRSPDRTWEGPEDIRLVDENREDTFRRWTMAERADIKRFQMRNLKLDGPAPILEGTDYQQKRIRLSDFAGKIVILTATMSTVGDREMYARCSELLKQFKGQPVVCLSIVPTDGDGGSSVRDIVRQCNITWPIIRDTRGDRLAHRWCQQTFAEAYVIDAHGVIRFHETGNDSVGASLVIKVKELLKADTGR